MDSPYISAAGVSRLYVSGEESITALDDVSLEVSSGRVVAVTGPSGSGKSTLLHLIGAMDRVDSGSIRVGETNVTDLTRNQQADYRRTVGFVFQRFHLLPALSVVDNVAAPLLPYKTGFDKRRAPSSCWWRSAWKSGPGLCRLVCPEASSRGSRSHERS